MAPGRSGVRPPILTWQPAPDVARELTTTVTFLEMLREAPHHVPMPMGIKLFLLRAEHVSPAFYRFLYTRVGEGCSWTDRVGLNDEALSRLVHAEGVAVWVLYGDGQPAGFFELAEPDRETVEIEYFGLVPEFRGRGLGMWFLAEAIRAAWARTPRRVIIETCTLDGPLALQLYQRMGFTPYNQQQKIVTTA